MKYETDQAFQVTNDNRMVYNLRETGKWRNGEMQMENDVAVMIEARHLSAEQQTEIAEVIRDTLTKYFLNVKLRDGGTTNVNKD